MNKLIVGLFSILFIMAIFVMTNANAGDAKYIGAKKCKTCHMMQYKSWSKTLMATSFENLKAGIKVEEKKKAGLEDKDYTHNASCLKCHTTGYGKPGGFTSIEETPKLANVQCEVCHGPGGDFKKIMKKNKKFKLEEVKAEGLMVINETENSCMECHGDENPFNEKVDPKYKFEIKERFKNVHVHIPLKYEH